MSRGPSAHVTKGPVGVPGRTRAGWIGAAMLLSFLLEIVFGVIGALGSAGEFSPSDGAMVACAFVALAQASALTWAIEVSRRRGGGSLGGRRGASSLGGSLFVGFFMFFATWIVAAFMVCGHLNAIFGARTLESATVEAKTRQSGRGCHFHAYVFSDTVASGESLCVDAGRWRRLAVGDHLPVVVVNGQLGQSVALGQGDLKGVQ